MKANGNRSNYHGDRGKEHVKKGERRGENIACSAGAYKR